MRDVGAALTAGLFAPVRRVRLALVLWLGRLVPIVLFFSLPVYGAARDDLAKNPDARALLDAPKDTSGFAFAWTNDFFATKFDAPERIFWLCLFAWVLVEAVLAGGFVASFVQRPAGPLLPACGKYACRFFRLALVAAVLVYVADAAINSVLAEAHASAARREFTQDFAVTRAGWRSILFPAIVVLVEAVHSYARIDLVANERSSAFLSFARGFGILFLRLPKLLVIEAAMLLAAGGAAFLAWLLMKVALPGGDATWLSFVFFLVAAAIASYVRTGIELGTLEARCRLLVPPAPPLSPLETALG
ncbi:MAG: hypothetical protein ACHQ1G_05325, partial [Planctomycetota bacterium]